MSDLIDRDAAIDALNEVSEHYTDKGREWHPHVNFMVEAIEALPSAQRTGRWIWDDEGYHCSECWHHTYGNTGEVLSGVYKFCPNCGARMEVQE